MNLQGYCSRLGWDVAELARQSRVNYATARKAYNGEAISARPARDIAEALSKALGARINVGDIDGLQVR